jgi:Lar family restriction alleviation protein
MFETAVERREAFKKYFSKCIKNKESPEEEFAWLELECEVQLKPCPFCNGEARIIDQETSLTTYHYVECKKCFGKTASTPKRDKAIDAWNRRVQ